MLVAVYNQQCVMSFGISHLLEVALLMDCAQSDGDTVFHNILFLNLQNTQKNEEKTDLDHLSTIRNQFITKDMNQIKFVSLHVTKVRITAIVLHQGIYIKKLLSDHQNIIKQATRIAISRYLGQVICCG